VNFVTSDVISNCFIGLVEPLLLCFGEMPLYFSVVRICMYNSWLFKIFFTTFILYLFFFFCL